MNFVGSKKGKLVGARVHRRSGSKGISIPLGRYTSIMQAEVRGKLGAGQLTLQEGSRMDVHICKDSRAVFSALEGLWSCSRPLDTEEPGAKK